MKHTNINNLYFQIENYILVLRESLVSQGSLILNCDKNDIHLTFLLAIKSISIFFARQSFHRLQMQNCRVARGKRLKPFIKEIIRAWVLSLLLQQKALKKRMPCMKLLPKQLVDDFWEWLAILRTIRLNPKLFFEINLLLIQLLKTIMFFATWWR